MDRDVFLFIPDRVGLPSLLIVYGLVAYIFLQIALFGQVYFHYIILYEPNKMMLLNEITIVFWAIYPVERFISIWFDRKSERKRSSWLKIVADISGIFPLWFILVKFSQIHKFCLFDHPLLFAVASDFVKMMIYCGYVIFGFAGYFILRGGAILYIKCLKSRAKEQERLKEEPEPIIL